jgi:surfeit locus 1 family protein
VFVLWSQNKGSDRVVLVNRGWIPQTRAEEIRNRPATSPRLSDVDGGDAVAVEAFVRHKTREKARFIPENTPEQNEWHWFDQDAMAQRLGLGDRALPFAMEELTSRREPPMGGLQPPELFNNHLEYVITWYSLCVATTIMCLRLTRRGAGAAVSATGATSGTATAAALFAIGSRKSPDARAREVADVVDE